MHSLNPSNCKFSLMKIKKIDFSHVHRQQVRLVSVKCSRRLKISKGRFLYVWGEICFYCSSVREFPLSLDGKFHSYTVVRIFDFETFLGLLSVTNLLF